MKGIMVVSSTAASGKSFFCTALCRLLARQGQQIAPFKSQTRHANGTYMTATGSEIGYAQAVQAWAAGLKPIAEMNPILLNYDSNGSCEIFFNGQSAGRVCQPEKEHRYFEVGWQVVCESLDFLSSEFEWIVAEGDRSTAEIHQRHRDLTNMRVASYLNCPTILVVDAQRGGTLAQAIGTLELLEPSERSLIKGIIINKAFPPYDAHQEAAQWLTQHTQIPVLGVLPWMQSLHQSQDPLTILEKPAEKPNAQITIAVIRLPRIANISDFDALEAEPSVGVKYLHPQDTLGYPDAVILPGSKTTIADLLVLQKTDMAAQLQNYIAAGGTILGIDGGMQMLGNSVADPEGSEGIEGRYEALKLLPIRTTIGRTKTSRSRQVASSYPQAGIPVSGYEIHQYTTKIATGQKLHFLFDDEKLGLANSDGAVWGTTLHGIFDNGAWRRTWLNTLRSRRGLQALPTGIPNYREQREAILDLLADCVRQHTNLDPILSLFKPGSL
ncbi:cobyric acid synthase CobQ [Geitlerinema sp. PCC 9228]|uniref:cobyric acid synthase CobQ n=1 Tax=Geitlerinema sp. PCC 9228 TaxID=111611 RepID=UPI0008F9D085|nr:cobyric acid synthase CobQ [Geitlerinema sp. PCC 9228]